MAISKAYKVFRNIDSEKYTEEEKAQAIYTVLQMVTHNGVNKNEILNVAKYLFGIVYEVEVENGTKVD